MIRLEKAPIPPVLATNKDAWTAEFEGGIDRRRYAHEEIRDVLIKETAHKCAYCESRMEHVSPSHVEHIIPKSAAKELVCEWLNLTIACTICNTRKGTYHDGSCPLINPYVDEPNDHLRWVGPMLFEITPDRGRMTVSRLALNRAELLYQRAQRIERAKHLIEQISSSPGPVARALEEDLRSMHLADAEYSAAVSAFVASERSANATESA